MNEDDRLLGRPDTEDDLRSLLASAKRDEPSPRELASLKTRVEAALPVGTLARPATPPGSAASSAGLAKWILLGASVVGAGAVGAYVLHVPTHVAVPTSAPSPSTFATVAPSVTAPPAPPAPSTTSVPTEVPLLPSTSSGPTPSLASSQTHVATATAKPEETEEAMLARAHAQLLRGESREALETTAAHARAYPQGNFVQEREMIAIEALLKRGDKAAAAARAARFRKSFPGSGHLARLDTLVPPP